METSDKVAGLICLAVGAGFGIYLVWTLVQQSAAGRWRAASAEILQSDTEEDADGWGPRVRYAYTVNRTRHTSDRLYFYLCNRSSERDARRHIEPYPLGGRTTAYYNPRKPEEAVLDRRVPLWRSVFWVLFSACFLAAGAGLLHQAAP